MEYCHDHANGVATNTVVEVTLGKTIVKLTLFSTKASKMIVRHCGRRMYYDHTATIKKVQAIKENRTEPRLERI